MCPIPLVHKQYIKIIQVAATPLQRGVEGGEQLVRMGKFWRRKNGRITVGGWEDVRLCLSRALLYKAILRGDWVYVLASAMPVLCFVPVIRVFPFTCVSLPLSLPFSLPLPSSLLVPLVFAVPPFAIIPSSSWGLRKWNNEEEWSREENTNTEREKEAQKHLCYFLIFSTLS